MRKCAVVVMLVAAALVLNGCATFFENTTPEERMAYFAALQIAVEQFDDALVAYQELKYEQDKHEAEMGQIQYERELAQQQARLEMLVATVERLAPEVARIMQQQKKVVETGEAE